MAEIQLTPKERQALKALAHGLKPVVLLGSAGLSPSVVKEIDRALLSHELIKVKVPGDDRTEREELFASLAESLSAARVQAIGKLLVLFRPAPEEEAQAPEAPRQKGSRTMRTENRSPKAPATTPRRQDARPDRTRKDGTQRRGAGEPRHRAAPRSGHGPSAPSGGPTRPRAGAASSPPPVAYP